MTENYVNPEWSDAEMLFKDLNRGRNELSVLEYIAMARQFIASQTSGAANL